METSLVVVWLATLGCATLLAWKIIYVVQCAFTALYFPLDKRDWWDQGDDDEEDDEDEEEDDEEEEDYSWNDGKKPQPWRRKDGDDGFCLN